MDNSTVCELLDERERRTLDLVLAGHPNKAIGRRLGISRRSVARIKSSILAKTDFLSFIELSVALGNGKAADGQESCKRVKESGCPARPVPASGTAMPLKQEPSAASEINWQWLCCDLHDGAAQYLSAALMRLQALDARPDLPQEAKLHLHMAGTLLDVALRDIRDIIAGRSPSCSTKDTVISSIKRLARELAESTGIEIELTEALDCEKLTRPMETAVYRILQECLNNAVRHSGSDRIHVEVSKKRGALKLEVRDWGKGFDPSAINGDHRGLRGIQQRAQFLKGTVSIDSKPGRGTQIRVELPLAETGPAR